jgi:hypothetical protein
MQELIQHTIRCEFKALYGPNLLMSQCFFFDRLLTANCTFITMNLVCQNRPLARYCLMSSIIIVKPLLKPWIWLQFVPVSWFGKMAPCWCHRSTGILTPSKNLLPPCDVSRRLSLVQSIICIPHRTYEIDDCSPFSVNYKDLSMEIKRSNRFQKYC